MMDETKDYILDVDDKFKEEICIALDLDVHRVNEIAFNIKAGSPITVSVIFFASEKHANKLLKLLQDEKRRRIEPHIIP